MVISIKLRKFDHITPALIDLHWLPVTFRVQFKLLLFVYYTTKVYPTLKIFYLRNQLLIMLFVRLHNLFCSFQKSTAVHSGGSGLCSCCTYFMALAAFDYKNK